MLIAIDFDDTICNSSKFVLETYKNTINNITLDYTKLTSEDYLTNDFKLDDEQVRDVIKNTLLSDRFLEQSTPIEGAQKKIAELKKQGHTIVLLTGRQEDIFFDHTQRRLKKHFDGVFEKLYFSSNISKNIKRKKSEICHEIGADMLIDDMPSNFPTLKDAGTKGYIFKAPRNQTYPIDNERVMRLNKREELIV